MAHNGPPPGAAPRTLRGIALQKGTVPAGFQEPAMAEPDAVRIYVDHAEAARPSPATAVQDADPQPVPFALK